MLRNYRTDTSHWRFVKKDDIGKGFKKVKAEDYFRMPKVEKVSKTITDASTFIILKGQNKFFSFFLKPVAKPKVKKVASKKEPTISYSLPDGVKKSFNKKTEHNVNIVRDFYLKEIIPYTVGVDTSFLELADASMILLDEKLPFPVDFFKTQLSLAVQAKTLNFLINYLRLSKAETEIFLSRQTKKESPQWQKTDLENFLKNYLKQI